MNYQAEKPNQLQPSSKPPSFTSGFHHPHYLIPASELTSYAYLPLFYFAYVEEKSANINRIIEPTNIS